MGSSSTGKTWLITGASQGLGLAMALAALRAGHKVTAGARDPAKAAKTHPEVESAGGKWLKLDVSSTDTKDVVAKASDEVGGFDVVVNNAGYLLAGTIEELDEDEMQRAFNTNFWGPIRVLKGVLPSMRARKSGTIVLNSTILAFYPRALGAMYSCSKAAGDILQSTLNTELKAFNIRTITITAGLYRSSLLVNSAQPKTGFSEASTSSGSASLGVLEYIGKFIQDQEAYVPGDPMKFGERVVEIVDGTGLGKGHEKRTRFLLGKDAVKMSSMKMQELAEDFEATRDIANSTDVEGTTATGVAVLVDLV